MIESARAARVRSGNIFADVRPRLPDEEVTVLFDRPGVLLQRIASTGQIVSPGTPTELADSIAEQRAAFAVIARTSDVRLKR